MRSTWVLLSAVSWSHAAMLLGDTTESVMKSAIDGDGDRTGLKKTFATDQSSTFFEAEDVDGSADPFEPNIRSFEDFEDLKDVRITSFEDLENMSPGVRSGISDLLSDLPNLWEQGQSVIDDLKCAQLPTVQDCCKNSCTICVGGKLMSMLNSLGKFADVFSAAKVSQGQIDAGAICGMPEAQCKLVTQYFDNIPSFIKRILSWIMIVPQYYKAGSCPDSASSSVAIGLGLASVSAMAYLI